LRFEELHDVIGRLNKRFDHGDTSEFHKAWIRRVGCAPTL
jgi:hypothetical protein